MTESTQTGPGRVPHTTRFTCRLAAALLALAASTAQAQWQLSPTPAGLRGTHALGNGIAWASGTGGTVLRTTDDGAHWKLCPAPPAAGHLDLRGIQAFDTQTAIVLSSGDPSSGEGRDWNALSLPLVVDPHGRIDRLRSSALAPPPTPAGAKP